MGRVQLTNGLEGMICEGSVPDSVLARRKDLTGEILSRPMLLSTGHCLRPGWEAFEKAALRGLMNLHGFNAAVSFYCRTDNNNQMYLEVPRRSLAEIYIGDNPRNTVLHFSEFESGGFLRYTKDRLEDLGQKSPITVESESEFLRLWSDPERWTEFYRDRLAREVGNMYDQARALTAQAKVTIEKSNQIVAVLNQ